MSIVIPYARVIKVLSGYGRRCPKCGLILQPSKQDRDATNAYQDHYERDHREETTS